MTYIKFLIYLQLQQYHTTIKVPQRQEADEGKTNKNTLIRLSWNIYQCHKSMQNQIWKFLEGLSCTCLFILIKYLNDSPEWDAIIAYVSLRKWHTPESLWHSHPGSPVIVWCKGLVFREIMGGTQARREGPKPATSGMGARIRWILAI